MSTHMDKIREALERISNVIPSTPEDRYGDGGTLQRAKVLATEALAALSELETQPPDLLMTANYAQISSSATPKEGEELTRAAQAIINRWDSPQWDWNKHGYTGNLIADLRAALSPCTTKVAQ